MPIITATVVEIHVNRHLQASWNKYGEKNFKFNIIETCTKESLNNRENYWINYYNTLNNGYNLDEGYDERLKSFNDTYEQLKKSRDSLATLTGDERDTEKVRFAALRSEANRQARYLGNTNQFFSRTPNKYSRSEYIGTDLDPASDKVRLKMEQMSAELAKGSKYTTEFNAAQGKMYATIDRGSGVFEKYQLAYKNGPGNIDQSLTKVTQSVKPLSSYISEMGQKFRSLSQYLVSNFGFQALTTGIRSGVESVKELDSAMTELKKHLVVQSRNIETLLLRLEAMPKTLAVQPFRLLIVLL